MQPPRIACTRRAQRRVTSSEFNLFALESADTAVRTLDGHADLRPPARRQLGAAQPRPVGATGATPWAAWTSEFHVVHVLRVLVTREARECGNAVLLFEGVPRFCFSWVAAGYGGGPLNLEGGRGVRRDRGKPTPTPTPTGTHTRERERLRKNGNAYARTGTQERGRRNGQR